MLTVPAPAPDALDGARLRAQLADAGVIVDADGFHLDGDCLVFPDLTDGQRTAVQTAVDKHMSRPAPPDPATEFENAVTAATTLDALKAALLGTKGPGAEPRRPDDR